MTPKTWQRGEKKEKRKKRRKKERKEKKCEKENQWEGSTEVVLKWKRIRLLLFSSILHPPPPPNPPPPTHTPPSPPIFCKSPSFCCHFPLPTTTLPSPPLPWPVKLSCMGWNWKAESCFCFKKKICYACFWHSSGPHSLSQLNGAMLIHHHQYVFVQRVQVAVFRAKVPR